MSCAGDYFSAKDLYSFLPFFCCFLQEKNRKQTKRKGWGFFLRKSTGIHFTVNQSIQVILLFAYKITLVSVCVYVYACIVMFVF